VNEYELRNAIKYSPNKLMFLFKGHWVAIMMDDKINDLSTENGKDNKVIKLFDQNGSLWTKSSPLVKLPVTISIQDGKQFKSQYSKLKAMINSLRADL